MKMPANQLIAFLTEIGRQQQYMQDFWVPFALEWARWENTTANFNPLACTDSSLPSTTFNSDGVREFATFEDGITATIRTLDPSSHYSSFTDYYPAIRAAAFLGGIDKVNRVAVAAQIRKWGTIDFASLIENGWNPTFTAPAPASPPAPDDLNRSEERRVGKECRL